MNVNQILTAVGVVVAIAAVFVGQLARLVDLDIAQHHAAAFFHDHPADRGADSFRTAGDQRNLSAHASQMRVSPQLCRIATALSPGAP